MNNTTDLKPKSDRRTDLLAAARAIMAEKGFEATTVAEIVARAGVAQGTFYLYFPSKFALIPALGEEMNEHIFNAVRAATSNATTAPEIVRAGVSAAFQAFEYYKDVLGILHSRGVLDHIVADREQQLDVFYRFIAGLIRQMQALETVDPAVNPEIASRLIVSIIESAADECYIYNPQIPQATYIAEVIRFIQRALGIAS